MADKKLHLEDIIATLKLQAAKGDVNAAANVAKFERVLQTEVGKVAPPVPEEKDRPDQQTQAVIKKSVTDKTGTALNANLIKCLNELQRITDILSRPNRGGGGSTESAAKPEKTDQQKEHEAQVKKLKLDVSEDQALREFDAKYKEDQKRYIDPEQKIVNPPKLFSWRGFFDAENAGNTRMGRYVRRKAAGEDFVEKRRNYVADNPGLFEQPPTRAIPERNPAQAVLFPEIEPGHSQTAAATGVATPVSADKDFVEKRRNYVADNPELFDQPPTRAIPERNPAQAGLFPEIDLGHQATGVATPVSADTGGSVASIEAAAENLRMMEEQNNALKTIAENTAGIKDINPKLDDLIKAVDKAADKAAEGGQGNSGGGFPVPVPGGKVPVPGGKVPVPGGKVPGGKVPVGKVPGGKVPVGKMAGAAKLGGALSVAAGAYDVYDSWTYADELQKEGKITEDQATSLKVEGTAGGVGGAAGGWAGAALGAKLGATAGSVVPGVGTAIGAGVGAAVGGVAGYVAGSGLGKNVIGKAINWLRGGPSGEESKPAKAVAGDEDIKSFIKANEGLSKTPYKDSEGMWTVGFGHLLGKDLPPEMNREFTDDEIVSFFESDYAKSKAAAAQIPGFDKLNETGQAALIDLTYNMGPSWYKSWPNFMKSAKAGDVEGMAKSLESSQWYKQVGNRAPKVVSMVRKGADSTGKSLAFARTSTADVNKPTSTAATPAGVDVVNKPTSTAATPAGVDNVNKPTYTAAVPVGADNPALGNTASSFTSVADQFAVAASGTGFEPRSQTNAPNAVDTTDLRAQRERAALSASAFPEASASPAAVIPPTPTAADRIYNQSEQNAAARTKSASSPVIVNAPTTSNINQTTNQIAKQSPRNTVSPYRDEIRSRGYAY